MRIVIRRNKFGCENYEIILKVIFHILDRLLELIIISIKHILFVKSFTKYSDLYSLELYYIIYLEGFAYAIEMASLLSIRRTYALRARLIFFIRILLN